MEAVNIGPFLEACMEAWAKVRREAMENYGSTEGSDQEKWGKMGPLAEPTPTNAKNKGAADMRRRTGHGRDTGLSEGGGNAHEEQVDEDRQDKGEGNEESETREVRRAMAEAISEMEREEDDADHASAT